jgi:hypothetical protein
MEAMIDTGFTLAHNNGPIFNKGMMYNQYSMFFVVYLDIQRSGQMPELILDAHSKDYGLKYTVDGLQELVWIVRENIPGQIGSYLDWEKIEHSGSLGKYAGNIGKQKLFYPETAVPEKEEESKDTFTVPMPVPEVQFLGKKAIKGNTWNLTPSIQLPTFKRIHENEVGSTK